MKFDERLQEVENDVSTCRDHEYEAPQIMQIDKVEAVTHGSRDDKDDDGSGYQRTRTR